MAIEISAENSVIWKKLTHIGQFASWVPQIFYARGSVAPEESFLVINRIGNGMVPVVSYWRVDSWELNRQLSLSINLPSPLTWWAAAAIAVELRDLEKKKVMLIVNLVMSGVASDALRLSYCRKKVDGFLKMTLVNLQKACERDQIKVERVKSH
jgi:hypothetical protein